MKKKQPTKARTTRRRSSSPEPFNDAAWSAFRAIDAGFQFSVLLVLSGFARVNVRALVATEGQRREHVRFEAGVLERKQADRKFEALKARKENVQRQIKILMAGFELRKARGEAEELTRQEQRRRERLYGQLNDIDTQVNRLYGEAL